MPKVHSYSWLLLSCLTTYAPLLTGGCGSDAENASEEEGFAIDDGASDGAATSALATPDKETTLSLKTGASVSIPAGALKGNVEIGLKRASDAEAKALVSSIPGTDKITSAPYVLTPHGTKFEKDVEVTLPINKAADSEKLAVIYLEDEKDTTWELLGKAKKSSDKTATIQVQHFSVLVLVETDRTVGGMVVPNDGLDAGVPSTMRDASLGSDDEDPTPDDAKPDAGPGGAAGDASVRPETDAEAPDCLPYTCAEAVSQTGLDCGEVPNGCGGTLYCPDTCPSGEYCDEEVHECKTSVCGTTCDAKPPWESYCDHQGLGAACFPGSPAWECDEVEGVCVESGMCMQCDGKCIDGYGCDPDTVRVIDSEGLTFEDDWAGIVTVPAGAVAEATEFRIVESPGWADGSAPSYPYPNDMGTQEHCIAPYAQTFAEAITLNLIFRGLPQAASPAVFKLDDPNDTSWTAESGASIESLGSGEYRVTIQTLTLGCYGLGQDLL